MSTSGFSDFNLDIAEIFEEAYERVGRELRSGYDFITARRSLNLLFLDMMNLGVGLWTIQQSSLKLRSGTAQYTLDTDTCDLLPDAAIRHDGADFPCTRFMRDQYLALANKSISARPYNFMLERLTDAPQITFFPVPNDSSDLFVYWRVRYLENADSGNQTIDTPRRFLPAVISGLAFHLANKDPDHITAERRSELRAYFEADMKMAMDADTENGTVRIVPRLRRV